MRDSDEQRSRTYPASKASRSSVISFSWFRLRGAAPVLYSLALLSLPLLAATSERDLPPRPGLNAARVEAYVIYYTNIQRVRNGLSILRRDEALSHAAKIHSEWQATNNSMSHSEPQLSEPSDRVQRACKDEADPGACMARMSYIPPGAASFRICCSENVITSFDKNTEGVSYFNQSDEKGPYRVWTIDGVHFVDEKELAHSMVYRWMKSPGHRSNILDPANTALGFHVAHGAGDHFYGTQVFAPHTRRGIPSRDYSVKSADPGQEFRLYIVPGPELARYNLRAVDGNGNPAGFDFARQKDVWQLKKPAGDLPAVVRIEVEDDGAPGFFHPLCQVRILQAPDGQITWKWEDWEAM